MASVQRKALVVGIRFDIRPANDHPPVSADVSYEGCTPPQRAKILHSAAFCPAEGARVKVLEHDFAGNDAAVAADRTGIGSEAQVPQALHSAAFRPAKRAPFVPGTAIANDHLAIAADGAGNAEAAAQRAKTLHPLGRPADRDRPHFHAHRGSTDDNAAIVADVRKFDERPFRQAGDFEQGIVWNGRCRLRGCRAGNGQHGGSGQCRKARCEARAAACAKHDCGIHGDATPG